MTPQDRETGLGTSHPEESHAKSGASEHVQIGADQARAESAIDTAFGASVGAVVGAVGAAATVAPVAFAVLPIAGALIGGAHRGGSAHRCAHAEEEEG